MYLNLGCGVGHPTCLLSAAPPPPRPVAPGIENRDPRFSSLAVGHNHLDC